MTGLDLPDIRDQISRVVVKERRMLEAFKAEEGLELEVEVEQGVDARRFGQTRDLRGPITGATLEVKRKPLRK